MYNYSLITAVYSYGVWQS